MSGCSSDLGMPTTNSTTTYSESPTRHIQLDGQSNFRDIGGYRTVSGQTVKWRQVFRSGALTQLIDHDLVMIERLGVRSVINFLTARELESHGHDRLPNGVRQIPLPMEAGNLGELANVILEACKTGDFSKISPDANPDIHRFLINEGREYYTQFLHQVADPENRPLVFHCSHGIHRTGTATAILLSVLEVPWDVIRKDYLLSNDLRRKEVESRIDQLKNLDAKSRGIPVDEVDTSNIEAFYVLDGSYIDAALEAAVKEFGSMEIYIRHGLEFSDKEVQWLRRQLLND